MTKIFYHPHRLRQRERQFFDHLCSSLSVEIWIQDDYPLPNEILRQSVSRDDLLLCLERDTSLPSAAKGRCCSALLNCPESIIIATQANRISVDFVVTQSGQPYFFEFHERQHHRLSDNRPKAVFDADGNLYDVPRCLQRLIRDIWRIQNLQPLSIVWSDWFEQNREKYVPILDGNNREYSMPGTFCFERWLS